MPKTIVATPLQQVLQTSVWNQQKVSENWIKTRCKVTIQSLDYQCHLHQNSLSYLLLPNRITHMKFVTKNSGHYEVFIPCKHAMSVRIHLNLYVCHCVCMCLSVSVSVCPYMCVSMGICRCSSVCVCSCTWYIHVYMHMLMNMHVHIFQNTCTCVSINLSISMSVVMYIFNVLL